MKSVDELRRHLDETRKRGYALAVEEGEPGIVAIAASFRAFEGDEAPAAGTVSIAGPRVRLTDTRARELAPLLLRTTRELTQLWPLRRRQHSGARDVAPGPESRSETAGPRRISE